jgi:hypothetical protein
MTTNAKAEEYGRLIAARQTPAGIWEKWSRVDDKPVRRILPGFLAKLERRTDYHAPGSPANLAQKAAAFGAGCGLRAAAEVPDPEGDAAEAFHQGSTTELTATIECFKQPFISRRIGRSPWSGA